MEALSSDSQEEMASARANVLTLSWGVFFPPTMDDVEAYYARLREHALRRGYRTLATFMHAATGLHEKWTQPKKGPTLGELRKIREFLGVSWDALLDGAADKAELAAPESNGSDVSVRDAIDRIDEEIRDLQVTANGLRRMIHQPPRYLNVR